jgi:hypothetical protein
MKLRRSTLLDLSIQQVVDLVKSPVLFDFVAAPLIKFVPTGVFPLQWQANADYQATMYLFGLIPLGQQSIRIRIDPSEQIQNQSCVLVDDGRSALISKWYHRIELHKNNHQTMYTDTLEIRAGWLTPFVWLFAQVFYWHRQRRWQFLVSMGGKLPSFEGVKA